ncbi:MAG: hypothetical protein AAF438_23290 [Pseudomonadota bacterium]
MNNTYWISWWQPTEDVRPMTYPPGKSILGWWKTGSRLEDGASSLCAMVVAPNEQTAKEAIQTDWPEADEWRFAEVKDPSSLGDRFPLEEWMVPRFRPFTEQ